MNERKHEPALEAIERRTLPPRSSIRNRASSKRVRQNFQFNRATLV